MAVAELAGNGWVERAWLAAIALSSSTDYLMMKKLC
jgi:hypothetical protein